MSIHYVLIAKDMKINMAEYSTDSGNYQLVIANLLPKLASNRRRHFQSTECTVYTCCTENLQFICLTDPDYKLEHGYGLLEAVKKALMLKFTEEQLKNTLTLGSSMNKDLKDLVQEYNSNPESDKAKKVMTDLSEVKDTVAENLGIVTRSLMF